MKPVPSGSHETAVTVSVWSSSVRIQTPVWFDVSGYQLVDFDNVFTFTFHIFMKCSAVVRRIESSNDQARHPTEYGWSRNIRWAAQSWIEEPEDFCIHEFISTTELMTYKLTPLFQIIADLSLLALAKKLPSWLHSIFHTSSECTSRIVVVILGKSDLLQRWSE